jgi:glycosyltransferase involved in cell wall biosynthesis
MRVTLVCPFNPYPVHTSSRKAHVGGVERVYAEVSKAMARRGHEVTLVCSTRGPPQVAVQDAVRIVRAPRRLTVLRAPVADFTGRIPPDTDVVMVAATYPFTTPAVLRHAARRRIPSVLDFHFEPVPESALGRLGAAAYLRFGPKAYPLADRVVVRSLAYARSVRSLKGIPEQRWEVVPNGIDTQRFTPHGPRWDGEYLLFVGRLVPYKGLEVLIRALARQPPGLPLVVAGDGPLRSDLEGLATRLNVDARFIGRVADEQLPQLYRGARLTVLPSVNRQEAFGITLLESMACGTPVVASDLPGVGDVARLGGLVAATGDAGSLSQRVVEGLHADLPRGPALAHKIHRGYSWEAVTDRLLEVFAQVRDRRAAEVTPVADPLGQPVL